MHPKDPRQHGWKYKSFNYNDIQHAEVKADLNFITKMTTQFVGYLIGQEVRK